MSLTEGLGKLHSIHEAIEKIERELARGPKRVAAKQKAITAAEADQSAQKETITQLRKVSDEKSLQLKTNEARIVDHKVKLNSASSNREYEIIQKQIEADTVANSVLEDEILESLEKVDAALEKLKAIEATAAEATQEKEKIAKEVADNEPKLHAKLEAARAELKEAEKIIPAKNKDQYRRLAATRGSETLAPVTDGTCQGCNSILSPQIAVQLNVGKTIIYCQTCGSIMYLKKGE